MKFSFLERPQFTKKVVKLLEESAYFDLQNFLLEYPDWGDVIPNLQYPIRKARWKIKGRGKTRRCESSLLFGKKRRLHNFFGYLDEK